MNNFRLIVYRNSKHQDIFEKMVKIINEAEEGNTEIDLIEEAYEVANNIVEIAGKYGFAGNLWHNFIAFIIAHNENAFSLACEIGGEPAEGLKNIVMEDFAVFERLINFDIKKNR